MAIITIEDVQNDLPGIVLNSATQPTLAQATGYIANVESEVRGALTACFAPWPVDPTSIDASYMRTMIIEGVKYKILRAKYWLIAKEQAPVELSLSGKEYQSRLDGICDIAKALREIPEGVTTEATYPAVDLAPFTPSLYGSFEQYTQERVALDTIRAWLNPGAFGLPVPWVHKPQ